MSARTATIRIALAGLLVLGVLLAPTARATEDVKTRRFAGADRYATAAAIATAAYPSGAGEVVVASGEGFPDALSASFLAGFVSGPILLVTRTTVPKVTSDALATLKATKVWIVGGEAAVTKAVETELARTRSVERIAGADRYATAAAVKQSQLVSTIGRYDAKRTAVVVSGETFADALAGGPLADAKRFPLLLTQRDVLPKATEDAGLDGMEHVLLIGGEAAISRAVEDAILAKGITVDRLAGDTRFGTAAAVAEFALANLAFKNTEVVLADGRGYADALAGAAYGGKNLFPVLLMDGVPPETESVVRNHNSTISMLTVLGGAQAVADIDVESLRAAATCAPASATTLPVTIAPGSSTSVPPCSTPTTSSPSTTLPVSTSTTSSTSSTSSSSTTSSSIPLP